MCRLFLRVLAEFEEKLANQQKQIDTIAHDAYDRNRPWFQGVKIPSRVDLLGERPRVLPGEG